MVHLIFHRCVGHTWSYVDLVGGDGGTGPRTETDQGVVSEEWAWGLGVRVRVRGLRAGRPYEETPWEVRETGVVAPLLATRPSRTTTSGRSSPSPPVLAILRPPDPTRPNPPLTKILSGSGPLRSGSRLTAGVALESFQDSERLYPAPPRRPDGPPWRLRGGSGSGSGSGGPEREEGRHARPGRPRTRPGPVEKTHSGDGGRGLAGPQASVLGVSVHPPGSAPVPTPTVSRQGPRPGFAPLALRKTRQGVRPPLVRRASPTGRGHGQCGVAPLRRAPRSAGPLPKAGPLPPLFSPSAAPNPRDTRPRSPLNPPRIAN